MYPIVAAGVLAAVVVDKVTEVLVEDDEAEVVEQTGSVRHKNPTIKRGSRSIFESDDRVSRG